MREAGFESGGARLKTTPRGIDPGHERIDLLRHRTLMASRWIDPTVVSTPAAQKSSGNVASAWASRGVASGARRAPSVTTSFAMASARKVVFAKRSAIRAPLLGRRLGRVGLQRWFFCATNPDC